MIGQLTQKPAGTSDWASIEEVEVPSYISVSSHIKPSELTVYLAIDIARVLSSNSLLSRSALKVQQQLAQGPLTWLSWRAATMPEEDSLNSRKTRQTANVSRPGIIIRDISWDYRSSHSDNQSEAHYQKFSCQDKLSVSHNSTGILSRSHLTSASRPVSLLRVSVHCTVLWKVRLLITNMARVWILGRGGLGITTYRTVRDHFSFCGEWLLRRTTCDVRWRIASSCMKIHCELGCWVEWNCIRSARIGQAMDELNASPYGSWKIESF